MVFCNNDNGWRTITKDGHNPYFNRWFSAIKNQTMFFNKRISHNPYFNRWFSAIKHLQRMESQIISHNPYFNRWFSAIKVEQYPM